MDLVVIGLGYVGLPLVQGAVQTGIKCTGYDISGEVIDSLNSGRSHVDDLSDGDVAQLLKMGFTATKDPSILASATHVVICVPTPLSHDGGPDLTAVTRATETVAQHLQRGQTVVLESTTYPGTTDTVVRPILESRGLTAGQDFYLAFSPERIDPGNPVFGMTNTPKVVGGHTPACTEAAARLYEAFVDDVVRAKGTKEAETAKLLENTYRHINIALMNEMSKFCHEMDIDIWNVIECAKSKPFGFQAFYPGPGVGGHCLPIDPNYLSHRVRVELGYPFRFVELAQEINKSMPRYVVSRAQDLLNDRGVALRGARVLLLGVTYKPDIADERESPAKDVALEFLAKGANLSFHDPHVQRWAIPGRVLDGEPDELTAASSADVVVLLQNHRMYDLAAIAAAARAVLDTRGVMRGESVTRL
jgi:UDP-N-acetyl-D-glucosamine dehydrogenase